MGLGDLWPGSSCVSPDLVGFGRKREKERPTDWDADPSGYNCDLSEQATVFLVITDISAVVT